MILIRHGQSLWNQANRFTGWIDIDLSEEGKLEAKEVSEKLKNIPFTLAYTSFLSRANNTLKIILDELKIDVPIKKSYKLNERHYGALQSLNKEEVKDKYGYEQFMKWRRSLNTRPPLLNSKEDANSGYTEIYRDIDYPLSESLSDTRKRVLEYYHDVIVKDLKENDTILLVAHGNSIRALISYLDDLNEEEILKLEIPTGKAIVYELDDNLKAIKHYYL